MSSVFPPQRVGRRDVDTTLGNHERRIGTLERSSPASGIRFDFDNEGDWLSIHTTGLGGPSNIGIDLTATDYGIQITSTNTVSGNGFLELFSEGVNNGGITIEADDSGNGGVNLVTRGANNGGINFDANGGDSGINLHTHADDSGGTTIRNSGSGILNILDDSGAGGINILSSSGHSTFIVNDGANLLLAATSADPFLSAPVTTGVVVVADDNGGEGAVQIGMNGSDWFTIFDRNNNSLTSIVERFRFFANGQLQAFNLPTSSSGLPSGSFWVGAPSTTVVNFVP